MFAAGSMTALTAHTVLGARSHLPMAICIRRKIGAGGVTPHATGVREADRRHDRGLEHVDRLARHRVRWTGALWRAARLLVRLRWTVHPVLRLEIDDFPRLLPHGPT